MASSCEAYTVAGTRCTNSSTNGSPFCKTHSRILREAKCGGSTKDIEYITDELKSLLPSDFTKSFKVIGPLDSGAFSRVFKVQDIRNKKFYAMKANYVIYRSESTYKITQTKYINHIADMYRNEYHLLANVLNGTKGVYRVNQEVGFVFKKTKQSAICYFLTELLGDTLDKYLEHHHRDLKQSDVRLIAEQLVSIVQSLHKKNVLFIDFNLDNIMFRSNTRKTPNDLVLIDFGLSIRDGDWNDITNPYGQQVFVQINGNLGSPPSRLGDLQSVCYILCYAVLGYLPWYRYFNNSKKIAAYKIALTRDEVFAKLPKWLKQLIVHMYSYQTEYDAPDYKTILSMITSG